MLVPQVCMYECVCVCVYVCVYACVCGQSQHLSRHCNISPCSAPSVTSFVILHYSESPVGEEAPERLPPTRRTITGLVWGRPQRPIKETAVTTSIRRRGVILPVSRVVLDSTRSMSQREVLRNGFTAHHWVRDLLHYWPQIHNL